ncbi:MAG: hypothetical protein K9K79_05725, partial [Desulfohalobiaceae bacterium]|nr:hypothetical protein [Desulfohalobiaceae bacterium]
MNEATEEPKVRKNWMNQNLEHYLDKCLFLVTFEARNSKSETPVKWEEISRGKYEIQIFKIFKRRQVTNPKFCPRVPRIPFLSLSPGVFVDRGRGLHAPGPKLD